MNEFEIQKAIYKRFKTIDKTMIAMVKNCYTLLENECDVFGVTKSMITHEFEIKISRSDFIADAKKQVRFKQGCTYSDWVLKSDAYRSGIMPTNHFWYIAPAGLISMSEIPDYAGFAEVLTSGMISVKKYAPKTKREKMPEIEIVKHLAKNSDRAWL